MRPKVIRYTGDLSKPIACLARSGDALASGVTADAVAAEYDRKLRRLFDFYQVNFGDWRALVGRLAAAHVPGLRLSKVPGRTRKRTASVASVLVPALEGTMEGLSETLGRRATKKQALSVLSKDPLFADLLRRSKEGGNPPGGDALRKYLPSKSTSTHVVPRSAKDRPRRARRTKE